MKRRLLLALGGCSLARSAFAQTTWPSRPITLVVPFGPGGIADLTARTVAQAMQRSLGTPIVVDNRPSAGSVVASTAVAKAAPDGYTLLLMSNANAVSTGLFQKLPFDVVKDFAPITTLGFFDLGVFVAAGSPMRSLGDVVAHAKAEPGRLTIGTIAVGSSQHLAAELFKTKAGIDALIVPYKGTPAVLTALRAGEIDAAFEILGPMLPQVSAKVVRVLAVTSDKRACGPAGCADGRAKRACRAMSSRRGMRSPRRSARRPPSSSASTRPPSRRWRSPRCSSGCRSSACARRAGSPKQLEALLASEIRRWGEVIRAAKIEPE